MNPSTFNLKNLPHPAPRLPSQTPPLRMPTPDALHRNIQQTPTPAIPRQQPQHPDEPPPVDKNPYDKSFGEYNPGTGNWYIKGKGYGGGAFEGRKVWGFKEKLRRFALKRKKSGYGNLSKGNISDIEREARKVFQSIPTTESQNSIERSVPLQKQKKFNYELYWKYFKKGKMSRQDLKDAKGIMKSVKV